MSQENLIAHWQKGARDALKVAQSCFEDKIYDLALFHCHLAVEKALKSHYIKETGETHPKTHRLLELAQYTKLDWSSEEYRALAELTDFAIEARYADPERAQEIATEENCIRWIAETEKIINKLLQ